MILKRAMVDESQWGVPTSRPSFHCVSAFMRDPSDRQPPMPFPQHSQAREDKTNR